MERPLARSTGVSEALAQPISAVGRGAAAGESFEALYRRTAPRVYAYVASLLRDRAAAEDVTALAFERAFRKRRGFRPARGTADAWVFGIARNAALDELRRRRRRATLEVEPSAPFGAPRSARRWPSYRGTSATSSRSSSQPASPTRRSPASCASRRPTWGPAFTAPSTS